MMIRKLIFLITTLCMVILLLPPVTVSAKALQITISSLEDLENLRDNLEKEHYYEFYTIVLTADIDMSEKYGEDINGEEVSWNPIGPFLGVFDGGGHTISGLYINTSANPLGEGGLFYINYGVIKNLSVSGSVTGGRYSGGIATGNGVGGIIENCQSTCNVSSGECVGGIAGSNGGMIKNCYNMGDVSGENRVGGIVGNSGLGTIENCYNAGDISGENGVGGIVGGYEGNYKEELTIKNCYNMGDISGGTSTGGIIGKNPEKGIIKNCHNTGDVSSESSMIGGIAGENAGIIDICYNTGNIASESSMIGGIAGGNFATIKNCYNNGNVWGENNYVGGTAGSNYATIENCYNIGSILGEGNMVGGIAGANSNEGVIKNCYYQAGTDEVESADTGIGAANDIKGVAEMKTKDEFASGSVAWLLQNSQETQVWGQCVITGGEYNRDEYPFFTDIDARRVLKVTFMNEKTVHKEAFTNPGGKVSLPANPVLPDKIFLKWTVDDSEFDANMAITKDIVVTAQWQSVITPEQKEKNEFALNEGLKVDQKGKKISVKWGKVKDADGYMVYIQYCSKKFSSKPTKTLKSASSTKASVTKINGKKLDLKNNFKVYVVAYKMINGKKMVLGKTVTAHVVGKNNKACTNAKQIKLIKSKYTLKVGKTAKIKAKTVLVNKKKKQLSNAHAREFRYKSTDTKVATVSSKGKITAKGKGTCTIYVYARNGYAKKVKVTVQ